MVDQPYLYPEEIEVLDNCCYSFLALLGTALDLKRKVTLPLIITLHLHEVEVNISIGFLSMQDQECRIVFVYLLELLALADEGGLEGSEVELAGELGQSGWGFAVSLLVVFGWGLQV